MENAVLLPTEIQVLASQISVEKQEDVQRVLNMVFEGTGSMYSLVQEIQVKDEFDKENIDLAEKFRKEAKSRKIAAKKLFDEQRAKIKSLKADYDLQDHVWLKAGQIAELRLKAIEALAEEKANTPIRIAMERQALLVKERAERVRVYETPNEKEFENMSESVFENYILGLETKKNIRLQEEAKKEAERLALLEAEKAEHERLKKESERLSKEREITQARAKELRIYADLIEDYDALISMEQKDYENNLETLKQKLKAETERKEAERIAQLEKERLQAERDEKLRQLEIANQKAIEEKKKEEEKAKKEAEKLLKAPLKKQTSFWVESFTIEETKLNHEVVDNIKEKFLAFKKWAREQIELI